MLLVANEVSVFYVKKILEKKYRLLELKKNSK